MKNKVRMKSLLGLAAVCGATVLLAGCGGGQAPASGAVAQARTPKPYKLDFGTADAGIPITSSTDPKELQTLVMNEHVSPRSDPFALSSKERQFNASQMAEWLVQQNGNMAADFELPPVINERPPPEEPQPYRRVSGIIVADGVVAIIDMGNGKTEIVRPGEYVPNTPWKVVSITEDEAVLRRDGNVLPKEIHVRLEELPPELRGNGGDGSAPSSSSGNTGRPPGKGILQKGGA